MAQPLKTLILWGYHLEQGTPPIKLCPYTRKAQTQRIKEGWVTGVYRQGDRPLGLQEKWAKEHGL